MFSELVKIEKKEIERQIKLYRKDPLINIKGKTVIIIDDGLATGVTVKCAIRSVKLYKPRKIIIAVPVCAYESAADLDRIADGLICIIKPANLHAVGEYYKKFRPVTDEDVLRLLENSY